MVEQVIYGGITCFILYSVHTSAGAIAATRRTSFPLPALTTRTYLAKAIAIFSPK